MEALTAAAVAALSLYDTAKAYDRAPGSTGSGSSRSRAGSLAITRA